MLEVFCAGFSGLCYLRKTHYFSTHGCNRFVSCFAVGALDELAAAAAAACRALISKKLAIVLFELLRVDDAVVVPKDATRNSNNYLSNYGLAWIKHYFTGNQSRELAPLLHYSKANRNLFRHFSSYQASNAGTTSQVLSAPFPNMQLQTQPSLPSQPSHTNVPLERVNKDTP